MTVTRRYWTELCFIKLPTIARNTSGLSLATFWNNASSEDSDAPGCFSIKSSISFSAASMISDLSGVMISGFYKRRASTLCRELRLSAFVELKAPRNGKRPRPSLENAPVDHQARLCHDPSMDLEVARKALSKRSKFSPKRVAFFVVAGLCLVGGILLRSGQYFAQPEVELKAPVAVAPSPPPVAATPAEEATESVPEPPPPAQDTVTAPTENVEPTGKAVEAPEQADEAVENAEQPEPSDSGMILVSRQPVAVLASPSSSAPTMYGFPAGRPFRVIGHDGSFAHIQDLKSSASGWIDEAALAPPPRVPAASVPSQTKPVAVSRNPTNPSGGLKPKAIENDNAGTANSEASHSTRSQTPWLIWSRGSLRGYLRQR